MLDYRNANLIISYRSIPEWCVTIEKKSTVIGSGDECDVTIPDKNITTQHLLLTYEGEDYVVRDLDSKRGTWLNGEPLTGARDLQDGDELNLAGFAVIKFIKPRPAVDFDPS